MTPYERERKTTVEDISFLISVGLIVLIGAYFIEFENLILLMIIELFSVLLILIGIIKIRVYRSLDEKEVTEKYHTQFAVFTDEHIPFLKKKLDTTIVELDERQPFNIACERGRTGYFVKKEEKVLYVTVYHQMKYGMYLHKVETWLESEGYA